MAHCADASQDTTLGITEDTRWKERKSASVRETPFPLPHGRGDEAYHGAPGIDPRRLSKGRNIVDPYEHIDRIKVKTRDFR